MNTQHTAIAVTVVAAAGVILTFALKDMRPLLVAICLAWLGAEWIDHQKSAKARR